MTGNAQKWYHVWRNDQTIISGHISAKKHIVGVSLTHIGKSWKQNPKIGCVTERHFRKQNPRKFRKICFGCVTERHFWKQNPDKNPDYLVINLIFWVIFWDTCSWKGQLERTRNWKALSWKVRSWKVSLKLERAKRNWKEPIEVGKNRAKLERIERNWKASFEVGKFRRSWKVLAEVGKFEWTWKVVTDVGKFIIISKLGLGKLTN